MARRLWQIEIRVNDLQRSMAFFGQVFDWQITAVSEDYAMVDTGQPPIASLWQIGESGMPLGVCHYVRSADCDADAARAVELGGKIAVEHSDVPGAGAWTDTLDPWLNELAFWQPEEDAEPELSGSGVNPISWLEIGAADLDAAMHYYSALVAWPFEPVEGMIDYAVCTAVAPGVGLVGGDRGARLRGMTDYISVTDIARTCQAIKDNGGQVLGAPRDLGDGSLFALFLDPDQNRFGIVQPG